MRAAWLPLLFGLVLALAPAACTGVGTSPQASSGGAGWFLPDGPRVTSGNKVTPLVDGDETFAMMTAAIDTLRPRLSRIDSFDGQVHNGDPQGPIAENSVDHCIYGTAPEDGPHPYGSIYKFTLDGVKGTKTTVFSFHPVQGKFPWGVDPHGVTAAKNGDVYGICTGGGKYGVGTIWRLPLGATEPVVLWDFHGGRIDPPLPYPKQPTKQQILDAAAGGPLVPPVIDEHGTLYGVTSGGTGGVLYTLGAGGYHGIYMFNPKDAPDVGYFPTSLIVGRDGALYGTTGGGGLRWGTVFKAPPGGGPPTCLHKFDYKEGAGADAIMQDEDFNLFGTCGGGGPGATPGPGLVFELNKAGEFSVRHVFDGATGLRPVGGVVEGKDHDLYGVAALGGPIGGALGRGVIYRLTRAGHDVTVLHAFGHDDSEGRNPAAPILLHSNGNLYGTTSNYGGSQGGGGGGALWCFDLGRPDYLYLLGWLLEPGFPLTGARTANFSNMLLKASDHDVQVRDMLWKQVGGLNVDGVTYTNSLVHGAAILDNRTLNFGSHHQKILIVNGKDGLIAFTGGLDIVLDRIARGAAEIPVHDVHCRVQGPGAQDLLNIFLERWSDHPDHTDLDRTKGPLAATSHDGKADPGGTCLVQVGRTYGNASEHPGVDGAVITGAGYAFAPKGEHTAADMILHAINRAQQFIYIEDQYLVDTTDPSNPGSIDVRTALMAKLSQKSFKQLIIVIPDDTITDMGFAKFGITGVRNQVSFRRRLLIDALRAAGALPGGANKVHIFCLKDPQRSPHTYVHSKTWVFDDQYAIIGSANINRRSWTHDSEAVVGIYDTGSQDGTEYPLPQRLRMRLWAEHLGIGEAPGTWVPKPGYEMAVRDPFAADLWTHLTPAARVAPYDATKNVIPLPTNVLDWIKWDKEWENGDPDGL